MAPELIRNENYSEKVDIYSFGVVFWELLTCEKPYNNLDPKSVMFGVGKNKIRLQIPNFVPDGIKILLIQCFGKAKNRPNFKTISKHLDIFCQKEDIIQLDKEFEENKTAWKEDIGRTCRNFFNNLDPYELQNQIETKSKELDCLKNEQSRIMAEIDKRTEVCNKFYFRLQAISLELDQREENIICREKKLNIQPEKRMIKPLLKQLFKNESNKFRTFHFPKKSKNLWLNKCLDAQSLIIRNTDTFYYTNKYRRFKVTRNYGLNFYDCVHIKLILKFNLDSKIFFSILNEKNLCENNRLHFLNFKSRKLKKLNKLKERTNLFFILQRHKVFNELYELRQRPSLIHL
ncbi:mitogen-activated kinase kinase kinase 13-like [Brachionus plicatilis]|uniref:Mitogen-activated kinase kinase kinase 13-like n=1 Tax=Brachionus plicatilis TaxID=10195 RepID=A0A3M7SC63_BRAPC|nr:mitogen-activated kinase kinase kinase 13-like [Brachionus plicatilis]